MIAVYCEIVGILKDGGRHKTLYSFQYGEPNVETKFRDFFLRNRERLSKKGYSAVILRQFTCESKDLECWEV